VVRIHSPRPLNPLKLFIVTAAGADGVSAAFSSLCPPFTPRARSIAARKVTSDGAVTFRYVCPADVISESDKDTQGPLICAFAKYDLVAFLKVWGTDSV
jgi:hypothetical protein